MSEQEQTSSETPNTSLGNTQQTPATPPTPPPSTESSTKSTEESKSLLNEEVKQEAPESYEPWTLPDGYALDETVGKEVSDLFRGMNLTQAQGQALMDFYVGKTQEAYQQPYQAYQEMRKGWQDAVKADKELGPKLAVVKTSVARMIDGIGDPALASSFREAMDLTGAGDNPAFIKVFYRLAQKLTEGGHVSGKAPSPLGQTAPGSGPRTAAQAMYPNLPTQS